MSDQKSWNNRFTVNAPGIDEGKKLPKVPRYRRKNGEEVKGTLFTGPKKPSGQIRGNLRSIRQHRLVQQDSYSAPSRVVLQPIQQAYELEDLREYQSPHEEINVDSEYQYKKDGKLHDLLPNNCTQITSPYVLKRLSHIGRGSTATIYRSFHCGKFQVIAEKVISPTNETRRSNLIHELSSLRTLLGTTDDQRRQYIVGLVDVLTGPRAGDPSGNTVSVCLEYMHATLHDVVDTGGCMQEVVLSGMVRQMLMGLSFIHEKRFLHRDFKPVIT